MSDGTSTTADGYDLMTRTIKQMDDLEQQHTQARNRVESYRQILIATLERMTIGQRIDIEALDLLTILADDI